MDTLDLIIARTGLSITIEKMVNSRDEIKLKNPKRIDLIESMDDSIQKLTFSYCFFCELELEYRVSRQRNQDLEFDSMKNEAELIHLREVVENLKQGI